MSKYVIVSSIIAILSLANSVQASKPNFVPWPNKVEMRQGSITLPACVQITVAGNYTASAKTVAQTFAEDLRKLYFTPTIATNTVASPDGINLSICIDPSLGKEGYRLSIKRSISIEAATEQGLFWGTRTVLQLLADGPASQIPAMEVTDKPEFEYRAYMVDVARDFHSIDFHKKMVKKLSALKMNIYHIHFSDNQSYTLPSKTYPSLPTPDRHYTKEQLDDLVKLASHYHITIVPEIEIPGHASWLTSKIPDLACKGKSPTGTICAGSKESFSAITTLISETLDIFPGPYFHMGADEVFFPAWNNCPDCASTIANEKLKDNEALYNHLINQVNQFVRSKGRQTIVWEGFKIGNEPVIDKNIMVEVFENAYAQPNELIANGYDIINASWSPLYVLKNWATSPEGIAEWNALYFGKGRPPKPLSDMKMINPTHKLKGISMCSWETPEAGQEALLFGTGKGVEKYAKPGPRLPVVAERAWSGDKTNVQDLLQRLKYKP